MPASTSQRSPGWLRLTSPEAPWLCSHSYLRARQQPKSRSTDDPLRTRPIRSRHSISNSCTVARMPSRHRPLLDTSCREEAHTRISATSQAIAHGARSEPSSFIDVAAASVPESPRCACLAREAPPTHRQVVSAHEARSRIAISPRVGGLNWRAHRAFKTSAHVWLRTPKLIRSLFTSSSVVARRTRRQGLYASPSQTGN